MDYKTGWLAPDGTFFPCETYEHIYWAREIVEKYHYQSMSEPADEILMNKGWVQISISMLLGHKFVIYWDKHLTDYQKNFLKPYFEQAYMSINESTLWAWEEEND